MTENTTGTAESRVRRRRWITLGEIVAVAGLIVAALSLYLGWSGRRADEAERRAEKTAARASAAARGSHIGLVATDADGEVLTFKGAACALQSADITFPSALGVRTQSTSVDFRLDAGTFAKPLLAAIAPAKADKGKLPLLIESHCTGDTGDRVERALYAVPFKVESRFLLGKTVRLRGLVLMGYVGARDGQARLDSAWRAIAPKKPLKKKDKA